MGLGENEGQVQQSAARGVSGSGSALPHREAIQRSFGRHDISGVSAHIGGQAGDACNDIGAQAYASGNSVAFGSQPDLHLAAHETAHVIQQRGGVQLKGGVGQEGDAYEKHADAVADRVVQGKSAESLLDGFAGSSSSSGSDGVQRSQAVQLRRASKDDPTKWSSDSGKTLLVDRRVLYSQASLIDHANDELQKAGKKGSFVKLTKGAAKKHEGKDLVKVVPEWDPKGKDAGQHDPAEKSNASGGKDTHGNTGGDMALWADCGKSSSAVTGATATGNSDRVGVYNKDGKEATTSGRRDSGQKNRAKAGRIANAMYFDVIPGFIAKPENLKFLKEGVHYTKSSSGKTIKTPADGLEAQKMYGEMTAEGQDKFDKEAGINHYANPEIGESYTMATGSDLPGFAKHSGHRTWNFHYAGVILKDGKDNVTLENYATGNAAEINKSWIFMMYGTTKTDGSADETNTFHHDHLETKTHGTKATTMDIRSKK